MSLTDKDMEEEEVTNRIKERMSLKHQNTGKWAKMALVHSHNDKSLRMAYHEAVQLGQELSKKIDEDPSKRGRGRGNVNSDDDSGKYSDSSDSGDSDQDHCDYNRKKKGAKNRITLSAAKQVQDVLSGVGQTAAVDGKYKKLFEMDFMKKAADQQRERAKAEARSVLREIEVHYWRLLNVLYGLYLNYAKYINKYNSNRKI